MPSRARSRPLPSTPTDIRLFFALWPGPAERAWLVELQNCLAAKGRRIAPRQLHLTLAFMGQVPVDRLAELEQIAVRQSLPREALVLDTLGWFERPRVGWVGCSVVPEAWAALARSVSAALAAAGFRSEERDWLPHISLYRDLRTPFANMRFEAIEWRPEALHLVQSEPGENGPEYRSLGQWPRG